MKFNPLVVFYCIMNSIYASSSSDMVANISYFDKAGKMHSFELPYLVNPYKTQYGVKFGIMVYFLETKDCKIIVDDDIIEYFAAYIEISSSCQPVDIIKDATTHGADFIFANVKALEDYDSMLTNTYEVPVFPIDLAMDNDLFKFGEVEYDRRYINVEFEMVS